MYFYRHKNGRFRSHGDWIVIWMLRGFLAVLLYAGMLSVVSHVKEWWHGVIQHQQELYYEAKRISTPIIAQNVFAEQENIEALKAEVVERLRKNESGDFVSTNDLLFQTFDPPSSMKKKCARVGGVMPLECSSFGEFQTKVGSIKMWRKMLGRGDMSDREAMELALDTPRMREFVTQVIFDLPSGEIWRWSGAVKERGWFNEKISHIRELTR